MDRRRVRAPAANVPVPIRVRAPSRLRGDIEDITSELRQLLERVFDPGSDVVYGSHAGAARGEQIGVDHIIDVHEVADDPGIGEWRERAAKPGFAEGRHQSPRSLEGPGCREAGQ